VLTGESLETGDVFLGAAGDDHIPDMDAAVAMLGGSFYGGPGNDGVSTQGGGTFYGGDGDDQVSIGMGEGTFYGEAGQDVAFGVDGGIFYGGDGDDAARGVFAIGAFDGGSGHDAVRDMVGGTFDVGPTTTRSTTCVSDLSGSVVLDAQTPGRRAQLLALAHQRFQLAQATIDLTLEITKRSSTDMTTPPRSPFPSVRIPDTRGVQPGASQIAAICRTRCGLER
jgi:hypothetical protein